MLVFVNLCIRKLPVIRYTGFGLPSGIVYSELCAISFLKGYITLLAVMGYHQYVTVWKLETTVAFKCLDFVTPVAICMYYSMCARNILHDIVQGRGSYWGVDVVTIATLPFPCFHHE